MGFTLKIRGEGRTRRKLEVYAKKVEKRLEKTVEKTADIVFRKSQLRVPVKTGALKASGKVEVVRPLTRKIVYTDPAAVPQEVGTVRHGSQPYLRPSVESERRRFNSKIKKDLKE